MTIAAITFAVGPVAVLALIVGAILGFIVAAALYAMDTRGQDVRLRTARMALEHLGATSDGSYEMGLYARYALDLIDGTADDQP